LTPERQRLAAVIDRVAQIETELDRLAEARTKIGRPQIDAITEAEAKLATARVNEPARLVDEALGRTGDELTVAQAENALGGIKAEMERRRSAQVLLDGEQERLESRLRFAVADRHESVGAVLQAECLASLFDAFDAALARVGELRSILLMGLPGLSQRDLDRASVVGRPGTGRGVARFRAALAAMEAGGDASAPLPTIDDLLGADPEPVSAAA
jgi:hypothetical protein